MKYIKKYNESKLDYSNLIDQVIDEITSVFSDNEWGEIKSTCSGPGEPYQYELRKYDKNSKEVLKYLKYEMERYGNVSIGFNFDLSENSRYDALTSITEYQNFFTKMKKFILNISYLDIKCENLNFKNNDLVSIRIVEKDIIKHS